MRSSQIDIAPWGHKWIGLWMDGWDGSLGGVRYEAHYGAKTLWQDRMSKSGQNFNF